MENFVCRIAKVNKSINVDGFAVIEKILKTCQEMLTDRGFTKIVTSQNLASDILNSKYIMRGTGEGLKTTDVFMCTEDKAGVKFVRSILEDNNFVICISVEGPTPFTKKEADETRIQFMSCSRLCTNVTKHQLVPKHTKVETCSYDKEKLPKILITDPIVQYYNWPIGTVVHTKRVLAGHEPIDYFRVVSGSS